MSGKQQQPNSTVPIRHISNNYINFKSVEEPLKDIALKMALDTHKYIYNPHRAASFRLKVLEQIYSKSIEFVCLLNNHTYTYTYISV